MITRYASPRGHPVFRCAFRPDRAACCSRRARRSAPGRRREFPWISNSSVSGDSMLIRPSSTHVNQTARSSAVRVSRRWRPALVGLSCIAVILAASACVFRVAWLFEQSGPSGVLSASMTIQHGSFVMEWLRGPPLPQGREGSSWIFNRQIDVGFRPRLSIDRSFGRTRLEAPATLLLLAPLFLAAGVICFRRLRKPLPPNTCRCGYPLAGLGGSTSQCPECGRDIDPLGQ